MKGERLIENEPRAVAKRKFLSWVLETRAAERRASRARPHDALILTALVSRVACMRLLDCVIFSARHAARALLDDPRATPCLPPPAAHEVKPSAMAGTASTSCPRPPPRPRIQPAEIFYRISNLTPRITRPPTPLPRMT